MEPLTIFASTVGFIAACHLVATTAEYLGKGKQARESHPVTREDWYCFFSPADLLGTESGDSTEPQQPTMSDDQRLEQRRRQQANRPRLQA